MVVLEVKDIVEMQRSLAEKEQHCSKVRSLSQHAHNLWHLLRGKALRRQCKHTWGGSGSIYCQECNPLDSCVTKERQHGRALCVCTLAHWQSSNPNPCRQAQWLRQHCTTWSPRQRCFEKAIFCVYTPTVAHIHINTDSITHTQNRDTIGSLFLNRVKRPNHTSTHIILRCQWLIAGS